MVLLSILKYRGNEILHFDILKKLEGTVEFEKSSLFMAARCGPKVSVCPVPRGSFPPTGFLDNILGW